MVDVGSCCDHVVLFLVLFTYSHQQLTWSEVNLNLLHRCCQRTVDLKGAQLYRCIPVTSEVRTLNQEVSHTQVDIAQLQLGQLVRFVH